METTGAGSNTPARKPRGFAAMTPERLREVARSGGAAAKAAGSLHRFTAEQVARGGSAGGSIISRNREHMREIGRRGGLSKGRRTRPAVETDQPKPEAAGGFYAWANALPDPAPYQTDA